MSTIVGALRRLVLAPSLDEVTFGARGFPGRDTDAGRHLETIPQHVILGFEFGIESRDEAETVTRLEMVQREFRGFAYEGATMAFTLLDVMSPRRHDRTGRFLAGPAAPHLFLAYIGIGFAMARLPRRLWPKLLPDLTGTPLHPTLSWLVVDGYGFDRAYFQTGRWVDRQYVPPAYPWQGAPEYFRRAVDQGIGRALWFIHGAQVPEVAAAVEAFDADRRSDLWSGVGLAAAYAGAGDGEVLADLRKASGAFRPEVAQGAVFAAKARAHAGLQTPHTRTATQVLCDLSVEEAAAMADSAASALGEAAVSGEPVPDYERWRRSVQRCFR